MIRDLRFAIYETFHNWRRFWLFTGLALLLSTLNAPFSTLLAFEGRISATITRGDQTEGLRYAVSTNFLRVEMTATNWPNPVDILDRGSGVMTLLFPHNRSFVRLKPAAQDSVAMPPGFLPMPDGLPPGVGPQAQPPGAPAPPNASQLPMPPKVLPPGVGPQSSAFGATPTLPMPMMPMPMEKMELKATGEKTNLLGFACEKFELKQRGEVMEIWATDQLLPFQNYVRNQPPRFGPQMIEEKWGDLLKAKKLFPLLAVLRFEPMQSPAGSEPPAVAGPERYRFEVQSITPQKLKPEDLKLFQPPDGYVQIEPLPF